MSAKQDTRKRSARQTGNGDSPNGNGTLAEAIAYEEAIRQEAAELREDEKELTPELFMALWPLLRRPIPPGFIETTDAVKGKPYESTGIKSVQVCIDRMDNVLTPVWWHDEVEYADDGKLATVAITVGSPGHTPLLTRRSAGGVNQGSTIGNIYKGSYTNAAKRAFAMVGVGHEVYLGAADYDPDVNPDAAKAQEGGDQEAAEQKLTPERAEKLRAIIEAADLADHLAAKLRSFGAKKLSDLTVDQGMKVWEWVQESQKGGS